MPKLSMWIGALILAGLVQVALDAQDVFWAAVAAGIQDYSIGQYSSVLVSIHQYWSVLVSIGRYSSVVVSSFRIARNERGRRKLFGDRAITVASTRPLPAPLTREAIYLSKNDVQAGLNSSMRSYRRCREGIMDWASTAGVGSWNAIERASR